MSDLPPGLSLVEPTQPQLPVGLSPVVSAATTLPQGLTSIVNAPIGSGPSSPEMDTVADESSWGRVMDALSVGKDDGWGDSDLGLSEESEKALRDAGIFSQLNSDHVSLVKTFNEVLIRPLAIAVDGIIRTGNAALYGVSRAAGEVADVTGLSEAVGLPGDRLTRDLIGLGDAFGIVLGMRGAPPTKIRKTRLATEANRRERAAVKKLTPDEVDIPDAPDTAPARGALNRAADTPEKAGNINLSRIDAGEDAKDIIREGAAKSDFAEARRGKMSFEEIEDLAAALGTTADDVIKRKIGDVYNAEEGLKAGQILVQSAEDVWAAKAKVVGGRDEDIIAFQEAITRHMLIQEQVSGAAAELGRAQSAQRIIRRSTKDAEALSQFIKEQGGRGQFEDLARRMDEFDSPEQVSSFLHAAKKVTRADQILEVWINGLLSGPTTQVTNIMSNMLTATLAVPERAIAAGVSTVTRAKGADKVYLGEAKEKAFGIVQGSIEGVRAGYRAFKSEKPTNKAGKVEVTHPKAIPSKKFKFLGREIDVAGKKVKTPDFEIEVGGKQVRIPGRLLLAGDEFFKAIGYRQELNALAYRTAKAEKLKGKAFKARVQELVRNPTDEMSKASIANAEVQTYTNALGPGGQGLQKISNLHPLLKIPLTFIRTPLNIVKYAGNRSPMVAFSKEARDTILWGKHGKVAQSEGIAKLIMGGSVATAAWGLAESGAITGGGPTDPAHRALKYADGWQPYSVNIDGVLYSYSRMEPFAMIFGITADLHETASKYDGKTFQEIQDDTSEIMAMLVGSVSKNLVSKTWLKGPSDLIEAFNDPDRYGANYIRRLVASGVPTLSAQIARSEDPLLREARTITDAIRSRIPGMSKDLFPRRDVFGEPIELQGGVGPDLISPIYQNRLKNDPTIRELLALGVYPAKPRRELMNVELTDEQYDFYQTVAGRLMKQSLDLKINTPGWSGLPKFARVDVIGEAIRQSRKNARPVMLLRYPNITRDNIQQRRDQLNKR